MGGSAQPCTRPAGRDRAAVSMPPATVGLFCLETSRRPGGGPRGSRKHLSLTPCREWAQSRGWLEDASIHALCRAAPTASDLGGFATSSGPPHLGSAMVGQRAQVRSEASGRPWVSLLTLPWASRLGLSGPQFSPSVKWR